MIFSSNDLPAHLGDRPRFNLWHEMFNANIARAQFAMSEALPFQISFDARAIGPLTYTSASGTVIAAGRSSAQAGCDDHYTMHINTSAARMGGSYRDREVDVAVGGALLIATAPQNLLGCERNSWIDLRVPRALLETAAAGIESRQGMIVAPDREALRLLRGYLGLLDEHLPVAPEMVGHMVATIVDLTVLATGARGDDAELAGMRGLRRARLEAILDRIGKHYLQPALSAQSVGQDLGLSARYVQDLLAVTGNGFSARVLELRLQHARKLLRAPGRSGMRIAEIIYASGFNDISYFNRCFRQRFGCSPGAAT